MRSKLVIGAVAAVAGLSATGVAVGQIDSGVPGTNAAVGSTPNVIAPDWGLRQLAEGSDPLENPSGIYDTYGFLEDNADPIARTRTEPDENTYVVARGIGGPTAGFDYGTHFLFQGHENGGGKAYLTRINLDVTNPGHRITLLTPPAQDGTTGLQSMDGSTFDPFNRELLFTSENGANGFVVAQPLDWSGTTPPALTRLDGSLGRAGFEGVSVDKLGEVYLVEDTGGSTIPDNSSPTKVKQPNSFVYRFQPATPGDLSSGRLQAVQISVDGTPIVFHDKATDPAGAHEDAFGEAIRRLHDGETLQARWVTIHDTATDGTAAFDANAAAKRAGATPLKRPENGKFVPQSGFRSYVFVETGDTDRTAGLYPGAAARGAWGAAIRVDMPAAGSDSATAKTILLGDETHNSFDNVTFLDDSTLLLAEDRGDTLHDQENALDSIWSFDITKGYDQIVPDAKRLVALGRDPLASPVGAEDNEPTGLLVSDGDASVSGLIGTHDPVHEPGARAFFTQQHGENHTFELLPPRNLGGGWEGLGEPQGAR